MYTAEDVMSHPVISTEAGATVADAVLLMRQNGISSLLVKPTAAGEPFGIVTKRDVISKVVAADRDPKTTQVSEVMSKPVLSVPLGCTLQECSLLMARAGVRRLPVFEEGQPRGIVSDTDIFSAVEETGWGPRADAARRSREEALSHLAAKLSGLVPNPEAFAESILVEFGK